ncbi:hypothetical protein BASA50_005368 [Batrachochytrium salamandrivorans]|uniref:Uncharacterized protein n=1 Tax=Batrachochytrium salamandrivorans TaxID=1357716 RepID=A0ABQ8FCS6_9FUNG|nr:hypothetical protein BASA62_005494 [Batrachochytrium salamandrivorans]KAH6572842.1 hypothetical protein BASA60_006404 [Batrachochytrium salamandrivorans]KAH6596071.1 hypothetical protein BASA50_005368 [Batrachochytrium salamandrivorans]KAH6601748.1 hypothetical protein BASA61_001775 [Batrachochytrium salamandrivorans]KAH9247272.1 hypothetical protein BASA81_015113 [Batrachochytrium salamandrivorans]
MLVPTHALGVKPTQMDMVGDIAFWGTGGLMVQAWHNSIMKLPIRAKPHLYLLCGSIGAVVGYAVHNAQTRSMVKLEKQRDMLVRRRMDRMRRDGLLA